MSADVVPECEKSSATTYYWYRQALDISDSISEGGGLNWKMTLSLLAAWTLVCLAMIKGIQSSGKVRTIRGSSGNCFFPALPWEKAKQGRVREQVRTREKERRRLTAAVVQSWQLGLHKYNLYTLKNQETWAKTKGRFLPSVLGEKKKSSQADLAPFEEEAQKGLRCQHFSCVFRPVDEFLLMI